jgi:hypothetical protein
MSGLVACKTCGKEIAKGVKKCPHCGKDQRNWFLRHKIMTFIGAILVLVIISSLGSGEEKATNTTSGEAKTESAVAKKETVYKVGDTIKVDQLEVTVSKFEEKDVIGDPNFLGKKASEGGILVAIQYTLKNVSDKPVGMFDYPTLSLVDEKGTEYSSDIDGSAAYATETNIDNSKIFSDLNPDISVSDTQVYEISKVKFAEGKWYIQVGDAKVQIK